MIGQREHEVLRLVAEGCTDREISEKLYISPRTEHALTAQRELLTEECAIRRGGRCRNVVFSLR